MPIKRSQRVDLSVQGGEHIDSRDGEFMKAITTPPAKRGRPRKVVQETLDQLHQCQSSPRRIRRRGRGQVVAMTLKPMMKRKKRNTVSCRRLGADASTRGDQVFVKVRISRSRGASYEWKGPLGKRGLGPGGRQVKLSRLKLLKKRSRSPSV